MEESGFRSRLVEVSKVARFAGGSSPPFFVFTKVKVPWGFLSRSPDPASRSIPFARRRGPLVVVIEEGLSDSPRIIVFLPLSDAPSSLFPVDVFQTGFPPSSTQNRWCFSFYVLAAFPRPFSDPLRSKEKGTPLRPEPDVFVLFFAVISGCSPVFQGYSSTCSSCCR